MNHHKQFPENKQSQDTSRQMNVHDGPENRRYHEEIAQDLGIDNPSERITENRKTAIGTDSTVGWIAVLLSIVSLFFAPILFGGAGIIMGFISRRRDAELLGNTAIVIGIISIVLSLFFIPVG